MFAYPAFITPPTLAVLLYTLTIPALIIILAVWFIQRINRIDRTLFEILKELKSRRDKE
ncbi:hypothetical protein AusDCA_3233 [Desulfitobacterium sp. AusDCA]